MTSRRSYRVLTSSLWRVATREFPAPWSKRSPAASRLSRRRSTRCPRSSFRVAPECSSRRASQSCWPGRSHSFSIIPSRASGWLTRRGCSSATASIRRYSARTSLSPTSWLCAAGRLPSAVPSDWLRMRERKVATSGEQLSIACGPAWVEDLVEEALAGATGSGAATPTVSVQVESSRSAFDVAGWEPLTRGAWARGGNVVIEDVCSSGFDLGLRGDIDRMEFVLRWRPRLRGKAAATLLRTRFILLARAVLLQYPVLWRATIRGRAPLHAVVCTSGRATPML